MFISKIMLVNQYHLKLATWEYLHDEQDTPITFTGDIYGKIIRILDTDIEGIAKIKGLEDLAAIIKLANENDCEYVRFDDAPDPCEELPFYNWTE